jgi:hypothetical protein
VTVLGDALRRVQAAECVIDPAIIGQLLSRRRKRGPLDELAERERDHLWPKTETTATPAAIE